MTLFDILLGVLWMIATFSVMVSLCLAAEVVFYYFYNDPNSEASMGAPAKRNRTKNKKRGGR